MATEHQPTLVLVGPDGEETIELGPSVTMGREPGNDLVIPEAAVSRRHAQLVQGEEGFRVRDLGSTNGTFVNDRRLTDEDYLLQHGDQIRLGTSERFLVFTHAATAAVEVKELEELEPAQIEGTAILPAVEVEPAALEGEAPALEEAPAAPPAGGLIGLLYRLKLRSLSEAAAQVEALAEEEEIVPVKLAPLAKLSRALLNLREDISLLLRRRVLTLTVENGVIRAVVVQGGEVVAWGIADPEDRDESEEESDLPADRTDLARMGFFLKELRAHRARVVTELPPYVPLVRNFSLPAMRKRYLPAVVESEVVGSIPFGGREVDIKWQSVKGGEGTQVMAVAVQKRVLDEHVERLKGAGSGPKATYSKAAALGHAAGVPEAMVVHLGTDQAAVVLIRGGALWAVHQVLIPPGAQSPQDQAEAVGRAIEQMEGFNQTLAAGESEGPLPLVLTGQVPVDGLLRTELKQTVGRDILGPSPSIVCPDGFPIEEYAANLGLAALHQAKPKGWRKSSEGAPASPNLLSERHLPAPLPFAPMAVFLALTLFLVTAFNLTEGAPGGWPPTAPRVSALTAEKDAKIAVLATKQDQARVVAMQLGAAGKFHREAQQARQDTLDLRARRAAFRSDIESWGTWFDMIKTITEGALPRDDEGLPTVQISSFTPIGNEFTLSGTAPTLDLAIEFMENIRRSPLFVDVSIKQVAASGFQPVTPPPAIGASQAPSPTGIAGLGALLGGGGAAGGRAPEVPDAGASLPEAAGGEFSFAITATAIQLEDEEEPAK